MEPTTPTPVEQAVDLVPTSIKPKVPLWAWIVLGVAVILASLVALLGYGERSTTHELTTTKATVEQLHSENAYLKLQISTLQEQVTRRSTSGIVKDHTVFPDGKIVDHTVGWKTTESTDIKAQVTQALTEAKATSSAATQTNETTHALDKTTIKKMAVDVGLGYSTTATWWPYFGARIFGPVGAFAEAELDPTKGFKFFRQGVGGIKLSF